jgi:hypothetical protein
MRADKFLKALSEERPLKRWGLEKPRGWKRSNQLGDALFEHNLDDDSNPGWFY